MFKTSQSERLPLTLGRAPTTIARELSRNSCYGVYARKSAEGCAAKRRMQARPVPKLNKESILFGIFQHLLCIRWSPEQISMTLSATYRKGYEHRVSHETIYNCIYARPVGELRCDLIKRCDKRKTSACLAAKDKTAGAKFLTWSASMYTLLRLGTASSWDNEKVIS